MQETFELVYAPSLSQNHLYKISNNIFDEKNVM